MATAITESSPPSAPRTRIERSGEGVIAAYVHSLAQLLRPEPEQPASVGPASVQPAPAANPGAWPCGGRTHRPARAPRLAEAL